MPLHVDDLIVLDEPIGFERLRLPDERVRVRDRDVEAFQDVVSRGHFRAFRHAALGILSYRVARPHVAATLVCRTAS